MFTVENLAVRLGDKNILQNVHFTIDTPGQLAAEKPPCCAQWPGFCPIRGAA